MRRNKTAKWPTVRVHVAPALARLWFNKEVESA